MKSVNKQTNLSSSVSAQRTGRSFSGEGDGKLKYFFKKREAGGGMEGPVTRLRKEGRLSLSLSKTPRTKHERPTNEKEIKKS